MVYNQRSTTQTITDNTQAEIGASLYLGTLLQSQFDRTESLTDRQTNIDLTRSCVSFANYWNDSIRSPTANT